VFYQRGIGGLAKDEREAARLFQLAANHGNETAQRNLAWLAIDKKQIGEAPRRIANHEVDEAGWLNRADSGRLRDMIESANSAHLGHRRTRRLSAGVAPRTNPLSREGGVGAGAFLAVTVSG